MFLRRQMTKTYHLTKIKQPSWKTPPFCWIRSIFRRISSKSGIYTNHTWFYPPVQHHRLTASTNRSEISVTWSPQHWHLYPHYWRRQPHGGGQRTMSRILAPCAARIKLAIVSDQAFYDPDRPTSLAIDASLLKRTKFHSETTEWIGRMANSSGYFQIPSPTRSRYAMIELECMEASKWGMKKCRQFLKGFSNFNLVTDHRPLIPILNDYS